MSSISTHLSNPIVEAVAKRTPEFIELMQGASDRRSGSARLRAVRRH
jgi:hypothetical protein